MAVIWAFPWTASKRYIITSRAADEPAGFRGAFHAAMPAHSHDHVEHHPVSISPAIHHLDGAIETGALLAVVGPNGAGKSTLFKGIVGVLKPLAGGIERGGLDLREIAYLPQIAEIDRSFPISVYDMVAMGMWRHA